MVPGRRRVQGIVTVAESEHKQVHTLAWKRAGDLNERLACIGKETERLCRREDADVSIISRLSFICISSRRLAR
jgi:hypothetical protein